MRPLALPDIEIMEEHRAGEQRVYDPTTDPDQCKCTPGYECLGHGLGALKTGRPASVVLAAGGQPFATEGDEAKRLAAQIVDEIDENPYLFAVRFMELTRCVEALTAAFACPICTKPTRDVTHCERCERDVCAACTAPERPYDVPTCAKCRDNEEGPEPDTSIIGFDEQRELDRVSGVDGGMR